MTGAIASRRFRGGRALRDGATVQTIAQALALHKLKGGDPIGFMVDGVPLEASSRYLPWWTKFRAMFLPEEADVLPRCLITGERSRPHGHSAQGFGLMFVGGPHGRGCVPLF